MRSVHGGEPTRREQQWPTNMINRDAFFEEAAEHVAAMEGALLRLEDHPGELELLHRIFRGAHSIKGWERYAGIC